MSGFWWGVLLTAVVVGIVLGGVVSELTSPMIYICDLPGCETHQEFGGIAPDRKARAAGWTGPAGFDTARCPEHGAREG